jgi:hypothetical protein
MAKPIIGHEAERLVIGFMAAVNHLGLRITIRDTEDERKIVHKMIKKIN